MNKLNSDKEFVVGKHNIGYISSDFSSRFSDIDFEPKAVGTFQKLPRSMNDAEIESQLRPGMCELGDILAFMDNPPKGTKDGYYNLFYTPSFVVGVGWRGFGGGWGVSAWGRREFGWYAVRRVFSPATSNSQTLPPSPSDPLTLSIQEACVQMKRIADALEKPKKVKKSVGKRK